MYPAKNSPKSHSAKNGGRGQFALPPSLIKLAESPTEPGLHFAFSDEIGGLPGVSRRIARYVFYPMLLTT